MRAIDTNVLVRFLVADDAAQARAARRVIEGGDVYLPGTVVLECEWVLRAGYGLSPQEVAAGLRGIGGLPGITMESPSAVALAIDWMEDGMDFADALHLASSANCSAFVTFDRKLARRAKGLAPIPVEIPPGR